MVVKDPMHKELLREIRNSKSRFISIFIMVALSVLFLVGLRSAAPDMRNTADEYFDEKQMHDLRITTTLGLTDEDIAAFAETDGVLAAAGDWSLDALASDGENDHTVKLHSIIPEGLNAPEVVEGTLPQAAGECAIEEKMATALKLAVGDTLMLEDTDTLEDALTTRELTITAIVDSPLYIGLDRGTGSLGDGAISYFVLLARDTFTLDYYTDVYILAEGAAELSSFSEEYEELVDALEDVITPVAEQRAQLRYESLRDDAQSEIDDAKAEYADGEQEYEDAKQEAETQLADGEEQLADAKTEGEQQIADAKQELADARTELDDGWAELETSKQTYADEISEAEQTLADAKTQLEDGEAQLAASLTELQQGEADLATQQTQAQQQLEQARATLEAADTQISEQSEQLETAKAQLETLQAQLDALKAMGDTESAAAALQSQLEALQAQQKALTEAGDTENAAALQTQIESLQTQLDALTAAGDLETLQAQVDTLSATVSEGETALQQAQAETEAGWTAYYQQESSAQAAIATARATLDSGWTEYYAGQAQLEASRTEYESGLAELEQSKADGQQQLDEAEQTLNDGEQDYANGLAELEEAEQTLADELADGQQELEDSRAEAEQKLADAKAELDDAAVQIEDAQAEVDAIEEPEVYVLDRNYNAGFVSYDQDAERMSNLANVFPLLFFVVAALVCLTTMTRMVEEQRTQIGSIKAMGYGTAAVAAKYLIYGALACVGGTLVGAVIGTKLLPYIICNAYAIMYQLPPADLDFHWTACLGSFIASLACTLGATLWAVMATMRETPATLLRPRAPKAGKRVFLEHIPFIWKRMNFSAKVTARNLLRYKKRFWMTVIGVAGCTALIVTGLGLHHGIFSILDWQYVDLFQYDLMVGLDDSLSTQERQEITSDLKSDSRVERVMLSYTNTVSFSSDSGIVDGYAVSVADQADMEGLIVLRDPDSKETVNIPENGVVMSQKLSELLDVEPGDSIWIESDGKRVEVQVSAICENYVRHYVYMLDGCYEALFGEAPEENTVYVSIVDDTEDGISAVASDLMETEGVDSASNIRYAANIFAEALSSVNVVVVVIILAAAALAFVVLYNLTNINITERIRELATIKVLGFFDWETAMYVYRENIILTLLGVALGQIFGSLLYTYLITTVEIDMAMFGRSAVWTSYLGSIGLSLLFAVIVNIVMYFQLKKIDMVESLKSVE